MSIVLRSTKGSPLTHNEMDSNWTDSSGRVRIDVRNESGSTLAVGTVVKATGYNLGQDKVTVAPTTASSDVAFGVIDESLANNTNGTVVNTGLVEDTDTSTWTVGTKLYSDGSGGFTSTKPAVPYQTCAFVLRSNANNGRLYVEFTEQHEAPTNQAQVNALGGRKNLIINGGMQVSQRGDYTSATTMSNTTYFVDRWRMRTSGASTGTVTHSTRQIRIDATNTATGSLRIDQKIEIEDNEIFTNKTMTLSARVKSNTTNARLAVYTQGWEPTNAQSSGNETWETLSFTFNSGTLVTGNEFSVQIGIDGASGADVSIASTDYMEIKDVQLELGDTATDFEHRSYGEELALCQRYYQTFQVSIQDWATGANQYQHASIVFPVEMRTTPTQTFTVTSANNASAPNFFYNTTNSACRCEIYSNGSGRFYYLGIPTTHDAEL